MHLFNKKVVLYTLSLDTVAEITSESFSEFEKNKAKNDRKKSLYSYSLFCYRADIERKKEELRLMVG